MVRTVRFTAIAAVGVVVVMVTGCGLIGGRPDAAVDRGGSGGSEVTAGFGVAAGEGRVLGLTGDPGRGAVRVSPGDTGAVSGRGVDDGSADGDARVWGAVELAVRFVASTDGLMAHSPIGRREILARLVDPDVLEARVVEFDAAAERLGSSLDRSVDELVWVEAPVAATIIETSTPGSPAIPRTTEAADTPVSAGMTVTVGVWTVSVSMFPGGGSPQEVWRTVTVTTGFDGFRWWVRDAVATVGPAPIPADTLSAEWAEFARVAGWAPVVAGEVL